MADPAPTSGVLQVLSQLRELWTRQSKGKKTIAVVALLAVLGVVGWSTFAHHADPFTVIGEGSSPEDTTELLSVVQHAGIAARLHDGKVEVPTDRLDEALLIATNNGLPRTDPGLKIFDEAKLGMSSAAEQINYWRGQESEIARSIASIAQVERARVHIAPGKHSVFKEQEEAPSASVALHLHAGQQLTSDQVRGVRALVARAIVGLKPEAVIIVDGHANLLEAGDPTSADRKADIERTTTARVRSMMEKIVGANRVSVVTTADVDYRKISQTEDLYDKDHEATRSETRNVEGSDVTSGVGGIAGSRGNLPGAPGGAATPGSGSNQKLQETKNYEVSHTVRQTTNPDAQLLRIHVAVVVDYKADKDGKAVARTPEELAQYTAVAREAAGIDDARGDKIEVRAIPFVPDAEPVAVATATPPATSELPLIPIAIGGGALLLVVVFLLARRGRKRGQKAVTAMTLALPAPIGELERALDARPSLATAAELPGLPEGRPLQQRVLDVVRADVERTAGVLTAWLAEPAPKGAKS